MISKPDSVAVGTFPSDLNETRPVAASISCPSDIVVSADPGECGAVVNFPDATISGVTSKEQIILTFNGDNNFAVTYEEQGMRLDGIDRDHIDAPQSLSCDNKQGALIHANTGNTWSYNNGEPFTPNRVYVCTTNMKFSTGDCGTEFIPTETGDVDFPDTPEWQNITSMKWVETGGLVDTSIDNFRFTPTAIKQTDGLESGCFFPVGTTPVTFTAIGDDGVETSCTFNVTVLDEENPQFTVRNITLSLNNSSSVSIDSADVLDGPASDNCGIDRIELSRDTFFCSDAGENSVEVTVTDVNGNTTRDTAIVTISGDGSSGAIDDIPDGNYCDRFTFPEITGNDLSGTEAFYTQPDGNGTRFVTGDSIDYDDVETYPLTFYIYGEPDSTAGCQSQESFQVTINATPLLDSMAEVLVCETYVFPEITGTKLSGNEAYYTEPDGNGTRYNEGDTIHVDKTLNYPLTIYIYDENTSNCSTQTDFQLDLTVCDVTVTVDASTTSICDNDTEMVILNALPSPSDNNEEYTYEWRRNGDASVFATTQQIEVLPSVTTTYQVTATDPASRAAISSATEEIEITVDEAPIAAADIKMELCDEPTNGLGSEPINLTDYDNEITMGINDLQITYHQTQNDADNSINPMASAVEITTGETSFFARVTNATSGCYTTTSLSFELFAAPDLIIDPTSVSLCAAGAGGFLTTTITTNLSVDDYDFIWTVERDDNSETLSNTDAELEVNEAGIYRVEVINKTTGCTASDIAVVETIQDPIEATATAELTAVLDNHVINIEIQAPSGYDASYQVMLDNGLWFDMNQVNDRFTYTYRGVETGNGIHEINLRDTGGCWTQTIEVITLGIPQFVTPNDDGYNDYWNIKGLEVLEQDSKLFVFDRYGKLLADLSIQSQGWNGIFNGEPLPSNDYWYRLELENGSVVKGHFSLKR
ncbi:gliding motility-associated C-terminal domain-containing protein [Nonlabens sp. Hel1_33_55]|nr:gliding motility-associated C-terminal domain-containing protein [Nonlabens sp. Hel1_33_55]